MRYNTYRYWIYVFMRNGEVTVYDTSRRFARVPSLDPALIGRTIHEYARPNLDFDEMSRFETYDPPAQAAAIGARSERDMRRGSVTIQLMSDGHEARFWIKEPAKEISSEISIVETKPLLSSRPPVYPPDEMVDGGDNPLLLASWQDPEMLGQGALEAFRLAGPPFADGLESVFDSPEPKRRLALHRAARDGDLAALPLPGRRVRRKLDPVDASGATPLMLAAHNGHAEVVRRLVELGSDPGVRDASGRTALHHGAEGGSARVIEALVSGGPDPDELDSFGESALHLAAARGHTEAVEILLDAGASPNLHDGMFGSTPLHKAVRGNHTDVAGALLLGGADPDAPNQDGRGPLHTAAAYGHAEVVGTLLDAGAHVNLRDERGEVPLHRPAYYQHEGCIALLIEAGADVNTRNGCGDTPLHIAASMNRDRAAASLIEAGARVEAENDEGITSLDIALANAHELYWEFSPQIEYGWARGVEHNSEVLQTLLRHGASIDPMRLPVGDRHVLWPHLTPTGLMHPHGDIDYTRLPELADLPQEQRRRLLGRDHYGLPQLSNSMRLSSILHDAVLKDMPEVVGALLASGASPQTAIRSRTTPLHVAAATGNEEMVGMLLDNGADIETPASNGPDGRFDPYGIGRVAYQMETALDTAVEMGRTRMVRYLLERGAKSYPANTKQIIMDWKARALTRPDVSEERSRSMRTYPTELIAKCPQDHLDEMKEIFREFGLPTEPDWA